MGLGKIKTATLGGRRTQVQECQVQGSAWHPDMTTSGGQNPSLWVDFRLKGLNKLEVLIHEALHIQHPKHAERTVARDARELARLLWRAQYRDMEEEETSP